MNAPTIADPRHLEREVRAGVAREILRRGMGKRVRVAKVTATPSRTVVRIEGDRTQGNGYAFEWYFSTVVLRCAVVPELEFQRMFDVLARDLRQRGLG